MSPLKHAALVLAVLIISPPTPAQAQSGDKIVDRYISAIGGKRAIDQIDSTTVTGIVTSADGRTGEFTQQTKRPNLLSVRMSWGDAQWSTAFNGRSAWQRDDREGSHTLTGDTAARVRAEAQYTNDRFMTSAKGRSLTYVRQDRVRGRPVFVVAALTADGLRRTLFFDTDTHLLLKDEQPTEAGLEVRFFDNYRVVDQVMEPHQIEWQRPGEIFRIAIARVTHNAPVDERAFDVMSTLADPLLNTVDLFSAVRHNDEKAAAMRASYAYTFTSTSRTIDQQGQVERESGRTYEIFHVGGQQVGRLIKKNGQLLSGNEKRQAPGFIIARQPLLAPGWLDAYLRMSDFSHLRAERLQDRAVIVIDYGPKPGVEPRSDFERQLSKMAGTFWIDKRDQLVIRIDSFFVGDYNRTGQGSSVWAELALVDGAVWLPSRAAMNYLLGLAFGKQSRDRTTDQSTDYKKFNVETDSQFTLPDPQR